MGTFITALVVFGGAAIVARNLLRKHKLAKATGSVGCGCGCGCSGCSGCDIISQHK